MVSVAQKIKSFWEFYYRLYICSTALFMLEPWERAVFHSIIAAFMAMASYTAYIFLPSHMQMLWTFVLQITGYQADGDMQDLGEQTVLDPVAMTS